MSEPKLKCPDCGSEEVLVREETLRDANTFEHYCFSVKAHDENARCQCNDCTWTGRRDQLTGWEQT